MSTPSRPEREPTARPVRGGRRPDLSRAAVLDRAIDLLDRAGVTGLTLRRLAEELSTGVGSIYWYVDGKDRLVDLATDAVLTRALDDVYAMRDGTLDPSTIGAAGVVESADLEVASALSEVRRIAMAIYRQVSHHPWLGIRLIQEGTVEAASLRLWDEIGQQLMRLDLTRYEQFYGASTVVNYVTGVAAAMDPPGRIDVNDPRTRGQIFDDEIARWFDSVDGQLPFLRATMEQFRGHEEDEQFAAGLDLILSGLRQQAGG